MKKLVLSGTVDYLGNSHRFSLINSKLILHDRIHSSETKSAFPVTKFVIPILLGMTDTGSSVVFIDSTLYQNFREQSYLPAAVIISSNLKIEEDTIFNKINLIGGTLNNFGDLIEDIYISNSGDYKDAELIKGVCQFESRPFTETDIKFNDKSDKSSHSFTLSTNRQFILNKKTINDNYRGFSYSSDDGLSTELILDKTLEMINFIKLISWENSAYIDQIKLSKNNTHLSCNVYLNMKEIEEDISISILDYMDSNNSLGNLYTNSKNFTKHHIFVLGGLHKLRSFNAKNVLDSVISFEQIIDYYEYKLPRMNSRVKEMRDKVIELIGDEEVFEEIKNYIYRFKGDTGKLNEFLTNYLDTNDILSSSLIKSSNIIESNQDLVSLVLNVINFRNLTVHTSDFDISRGDLRDGALAMTYINYYIILSEAGYEENKCITILNKLFKYN